MSSTYKVETNRTIVEDVLGRGMTREIWTANYDKALPISVQDFDLSAILPAVFYMFRFAHRRGKGKFIEVFGGAEGSYAQKRRMATIESITNKLAITDMFKGFNGDTEKAILGDLLLCFCLENIKHTLGRTEQVQRVAPAHYMASWVDLPDKVAHLRYVPEMIVAMLTKQKGKYVEESTDQTWFAVGKGYEDNVLLSAFSKGVIRKGELKGNRTSDRFDEETLVGLDQLLMIRLAEQLKQAPDALRGKDGDKISNQRPIAEKAAEHFSEDIRNFVRGYSTVIPRQNFVELLESCIAVGLTTILTSVIEILFDWSDTGKILEKCDQSPTLLFIDCSNGVDRDIRRIAEQSMDDFMRRAERFPVVLMLLRLLDYAARYDPDIRKKNISTSPCATEWLNLLGDLLFRNCNEADRILYNLELKSIELSERIAQDYPEQAEYLKNNNLNPAWRLAEVLTVLQGRGNTQAQLIKMIDSVLTTENPNGLAKKRRIMRNSSGTVMRTTREIRSLVFTDSVLDYLVHRHVLRKSKNKKINSKPLAFKQFINILHDKYGICVDTAPTGMVISNEQLRLNRAILERRLRDLGLFVGVNDAEAMKCLYPRFEFMEENYNAVV